MSPCRAQLAAEGARRLQQEEASSICGSKLAGAGLAIRQMAWGWVCIPEDYLWQVLFAGGLLSSVFLSIQRGLDWLAVGSVLSGAFLLLFLCVIYGRQSDVDDEEEDVAYWVERKAKYEALFRREMAAREHADAVRQADEARALAKARSIEEFETQEKRLEEMHAGSSSEEQATTSLEQTERLEETARCVVCLDAEKSHAFAPCGHCCCCASCSNLIMRDTCLCPVCRKPCLMTMQIYR